MTKTSVYQLPQTELWKKKASDLLLGSGEGARGQAPGSTASSYEGPSDRQRPQTKGEECPPGGREAWAWGGRGISAPMWSPTPFPNAPNTASQAHHIPVHLPDSVSPLHERRPAPALYSQTGAQTASPLRGPTRRRAGQNHPDSERTHLLSSIPFDFLTNCPSLPCGHLPPHSQPAQAWGRFPSWTFKLVPGSGHG